MRLRRGGTARGWARDTEKYGRFVVAECSVPN